MKNNKGAIIAVIIFILFIIFVGLNAEDGVENIIKNITSNDTSEFRKYVNLSKLDISESFNNIFSILKRINSGEKFDAVWTSNSIWLYMLDNSSKVKNSKSTSINPVVFGIKKSKANELGFVGKDIYTKDILSAIKSKKLKFSMSSATQTNTGATAYLGFVSTLAGNPEILKEEDLKSDKLKNNLKELFSGVTRSSGSDEFLEEMFLNGDYEAVVTYETSIININKKLEQQGKEPLYIIYAKDRSINFRFTICVYRQFR